ncbi:Multidrug resistance-associated protein 1 [Mortierella sp. NVP41]|nr:Multidrug resistance-associated protein 1 [Mortierella sp. NVP41]
MERRRHGSKAGIIQSRFLYAASVVFLVIACAALVARLVQLNQDPISQATQFGAVSLLVAWVLALGLNHLEHGHKVRSSTLLFAFYIINIAASLIYIRTMHDLGLSRQGQFRSFCVFFGATVVGFVVEAWPRSTQRPNHTKGVKQLTTSTQDNDKKDNNEADEEELTAYDRANLCSRLCFHYMQGIFSTGFRRPLLAEDIADQMPRQIRTQHCFTMLSQMWEQYKQDRRAKGKAPNLIRLVIRVYGRALVPVTVVALVQSVLEYSQVLLLAVILDYIAASTTTTGTGNQQPIEYGIILAFGLFVATFTAMVASGQFFQQSNVLGLELRTALIGLIYKKSLVLSPGARQRASVGEISNHMSVDCERIGFGVIALPMAVNSCFEIVLGIYLLYVKLGPSAMTSVGVILLMLPLQGLMAKVVNRSKDRKLEAMDNRVRILTEVLSSIKTVKMYSWESAFRMRVARFRATEIKYMRHIGVAWAFMCIMFSSLPLVMALLTFVIYSYFGGPGGGRAAISAQWIFVAVTLFSRLAQPLGRVAGVTSQIIALNVAFKRIQGYLLEEELDPEQIEYRERSGDGGDGGEKNALEIQDGGFAWTSMRDEHLRREKNQKETEKKKKAEAKEIQSSSKLASTPTLQDDTPTIDSIMTISSTDAQPAIDKEPAPTLTNINLTVPQGTLTAIVGRVGQGKSSLMSAMIGEMYKRQGRIVVSGSVAYVSQVAWILNGSLRDNILFGLPFEQSRYDCIVESSGLLPDIRILPAGDATEIGERGINLSGGQKQRVALARAAYQDADIYLLDDPLSAVDAHVDQHLWDHLLGPAGYLKDKTRVLITHGIHHLSEVDQILVMKGGEIAETGAYRELLAARKDFYQLITDYAVQEKKKSENEKISTALDGEITATAEGDLNAAAVPAPEATVKAAMKEVEDDVAQLILAEEDTQSKVGWSLLMAYFKSASYLYSFLSLFIYLLSQASQIGVSVWLQHWSTRSETIQRESLSTFLGVYAILVLCYMSSDIGVNLIIFLGGGIRSSRLLHDRLADRVLRLPMAFFDTTPVGRIVNRFSTDMDNLDSEMPMNVTDVCYFLSVTLGTIIVISFKLPIFLALVPVLMFFYFWAQEYYMRTSRALKRIHMISKSPLYQHFAETLAGVSTIRAMRCHPRFAADNANKSDKSANAYFAYITAMRWLSVRLEFLGSIVVLATSLLCVWKMEQLGTGGAGLTLSYSLTVTFNITYLVTSLSNLQNQLVSVDRILEYCDKSPEAPLTVAEMASQNLPTAQDFEAALSEKDGGQWREGSIAFKNYSTRYREGMELVIKNLTVQIGGGEKVGIVGRTGAGKSSLTLALFRLVEAANSNFAKASHNSPDSDAAATPATAASTPFTSVVPGQHDAEKRKDHIALNDLEAVEVEEDGGLIEIDGIDISTIGLNDLRQRIAIIPQDPTLFAGTVRNNLDPFDEQTDADLWIALERAHLKDHISSLSGGLLHEVSQGGENFSVGQRSLICLARALLRKTKILILDEATAAVDMETDELIQKTIRTEFKERTILTIAHRIKTVMDSDKILVLDQGRLKEFAAPRELLQRKGSLFYQLAEQAGEIGERS